MAMQKDGVMPNGRNSLGGRKPAIPAAPASNYMGNPPAGAVSDSDLSAGYPTNKPSDDTKAKPKIGSEFGTHVGATSDQSGDWHPVKRRNIATDAK